MDVIYSKNKVPIRLTDERWLHIIEGHNELAGYYFEVLETISDAESVYQGREDELIAIKSIEKGKKYITYIVVIYKEVSLKDGFITTAFFTKRIKVFKRRQKIWP